MSEPLDMLKRLLHGSPKFKPGQRVSVSRPTEGTYLVDRGMLCTSVKIPLVPGDILEYRGLHLERENVVRISAENAAEYLSRVVNETERSWVDTSAFFVYLPIDERLDANDA